MFALLFEVRPKPDHESRYLDRAAALRPILLEQPGLLFLDRYRSQSRPDVILSHSLWRDEDAIAGWRKNSQHRKAQAAGRKVHFADYRIRIAKVQQSFVADGSTDTAQPIGFEDQSLSDAKANLIVTIGAEAGELDRGEVFASLNTKSAYLTLCDGLTANQGQELYSRAEKLASTTELRLCTISRDYGMFDRDQAPEGLAPVVNASS